MVYLWVKLDFKRQDIHAVWLATGFARSLDIDLCLAHHIVADIRMTDVCQLAIVVVSCLCSDRPNAWIVWRTADVNILPDELLALVRIDGLDIIRIESQSDLFGLLASRDVEGEVSAVWMDLGWLNLDNTYRADYLAIENDVRWADILCFGFHALTSVRHNFKHTRVRWLPIVVFGALAQRRNLVLGNNEVHIAANMKISWGTWFN